jgi:hypothetical protein
MPINALTLCLIALFMRPERQRDHAQQGSATGCGRLTTSERRSRVHPVLLQKLYEGAHLRRKQAIAQG